MRQPILGCLILLILTTSLAGSAFAAPSVLELDASQGPPVIAAVVNGRQVLLEVEPDLGASVALNAATAARIGVRPGLGRKMTISLRGGEQIRGSLASARFTTPDAQRIEGPVGIFQAPVSAVADGVVGLGALPFEKVRFRLRPVGDNETRIQLELLGQRAVFGVTALSGHRFGLAYRFHGPAAVLNRSGTNLLEASGTLKAKGDLSQSELVLGLRALAQPVSANIDLLGRPLREILAVTDAPIEGLTDRSVIVVTGQMQTSIPARITLGPAAFAHCSSITIDRPALTLTFSCLTR